MRNLDATPGGSSAINSDLGRVDVFDERIVFGPICFDSFEYRFLLISRFSIITSTTQSKSFSCSRSSSMFPGFILLAFRLCMSISGFALCIIWMAFRASALLS